MSRTRQQVIFRIHELRIKANAESHDPPPSYEDSQKDSSNCNSQKERKNPSNENKNNCKKDETTIKIDDDETIVPLPSDAEILFTIAGKVQIFYINADGNVSAPSYPSTLFIFKLKSEYFILNKYFKFHEGPPVPLCVQRLTPMLLLECTCK